MSNGPVCAGCPLSLQLQLLPPTTRTQFPRSTCTSADTSRHSTVRFLRPTASVAFGERDNAAVADANGRRRLRLHHLDRSQAQRNGSRIGEHVRCIIQGRGGGQTSHCSHCSIAGMYIYSRAQWLTSATPLAARLAALASARVPEHSCGLTGGAQVRNCGTSSGCEMEAADDCRRSRQTRAKVPCWPRAPPRSSVPMQAVFAGGSTSLKLLTMAAAAAAAHRVVTPPSKSAPWPAGVEERKAAMHDE